MTEELKRKAVEMLESMRRKRGKLPPFLEFLAEWEPDIFVRHVQDKQLAMHYADLPEKCKILICLGVSAALGEEDMVESFAQAGKSHKIPKDEVIQAILLARFVRSSTVLKGSIKAFEQIEDCIT